MKNYEMKKLLKNGWVMACFALPALLEGRYRVYRKLVIVLLALIITGYASLSISVNWTTCLGASESIRDILEYFFCVYFSLSSGVISLSLSGLVSSSPRSQKLNPWWVTGLVDGEGCFEILIKKNSKYRIGYGVQVMFTCPPLFSNIFYKIIHTDSTSVNVLLINIFES